MNITKKYSLNAPLLTTRITTRIISGGIVAGLFLVSSIAVAEDYYDKHFSGKLNLSHSGIGDPNNNYRDNVNFTFGWKDNFDGSVATLGLEVYSFSSKTRLFTENTYIRNATGPDDPGARDVRQEGFIYRANNDRLNQAYLKLSGDWAEWTIGKQIITWGQFDFISPVDLALPFDFSDTNIKLTKVENRLPLTASVISFFPSQDTEISFYYMPELERDESTLLLYSETSSTIAEISDGDVCPRFLGPNVRPENQCQSRVTGTFDRIVKLDIEDRPTNAFRFVYRGEDVSFGLTYVETYWNFFPSKRAEVIARTEKIDDYKPTAEGFLTDPNSYNPGFNTGRYNVYENYSYDEYKSIGIELAIPDGATTYKFEYVRGLETIEIADVSLPSCGNANNLILPEGPNSSLFSDPANELYRYAGCNPGIRDVSQADSDILNFITNGNNNRLYVEGTPEFWGFGIDYYGLEWTVLFTYINFSFIPDENAEIAESLGVDLLDPVGGPALAVLYRWGDTTANKLSFSVGFIGIASGVALGYSYDFYEGMEYYIGAEILQYSNDTEAEDQIMEQALADGYDFVDVGLSGQTTLSIRTGFHLPF